VSGDIGGRDHQHGRQRREQPAADIALQLIGAADNHRLAFGPAAVRPDAEARAVVDRCPRQRFAAPARVDPQLGVGVRLVGDDVLLGAAENRDVTFLQPNRGQAVAHDPGRAADQRRQCERCLVADVQAPGRIQDGQVEHPAPGPGAGQQIIEHVHAAQPS
jgi:hypothetical protein